MCFFFFFFDSVTLGIFIRGNENSCIPGDEMFSDTYKIKLIDDVLYEVYGKVKSKPFVYTNLRIFWGKCALLYLNVIPFNVI